MNIYQNLISCVFVFWNQPPYEYLVENLFIFLRDTYVFPQWIKFISIRQKLMCPIQFQSLLIFLDILNGLF
jgi:hypothetical protein